MPESLKMLIVLTVIAGAAGIALFAVNDATTPLIAENERQFTLRSISKVLPQDEKPDPCRKYEPAYDNAPDEDAVCVEGFKVYRGRKDGEVVGVAVESVGDRAYDGTILALVGLRISDGMLLGIEVLKHRETPGLGALFTGCDFQGQMVGNRPGDIKWAVTKDGGDVDQLSGATISSRCMLNAVGKAQKLLAEHGKEILEAKPMEDSSEACDGE